MRFAAIIVGLSLGTLFFSASAHAQDELCPDGKRAYFGVCPDGSKPKTTPAPKPQAQSADEAYQRGNQAADAKDYAGAARWYQQAADLGSLDAMVNLGNLYADGGLPPDYAKAMIWEMKAANLGSGVAMSNAGRIYTLGKPGLPQNCAEGRRMMFKAVAAGWSSAQYWIGYFYDNNNVCFPPDKVAARAWMTKAAVDKDPDDRAQQWLKDNPE